ncbi:dihydrodipicolinate synthase family protein, partial [bacterium]|nr:dihydrodipicolinate synthase family protein [bacterium]
LAVGTTGESPVLTWNEHNYVVEVVAKNTKKKCYCIAGTGSNNTNETLLATERAVETGVDAILLIDPYYNGPSSLEIRREYVEPVARKFPSVQVIPYVIPGRTGTQLLPEDLAILAQNFKNVRTVKEATGKIDNMRWTRKCCGDKYVILSGDDGLTFNIMTDPDIKAVGAISVISNITPRALNVMINLLNQNRSSEAIEIFKALKPLMDLVTVKTIEKTPFGNVQCRARNPLAIKTAMNILGMPSGPCRRPLGKITPNGLSKVIETLRKVWHRNRWVLKPIENFFNVNVEERLFRPKSSWTNLYYQD